MSVAKNIAIYLVAVTIFLILINTPVTPKDGDDPTSDKSKSPQTDKEKIDAANEWYNLGLNAIKNKQYEKARDCFIKAISYYDEFVEAHAKLGDTYGMFKEEELAYAHYKKCTELIDKMVSPPPEMLKLREECHRKTEKFRIIEDKIAALNKEFIAKLMIIGKQCLDENDDVLAEEVFYLILQIDETNTEASEHLRKLNKRHGEKLQNDSENE
ncbi:MAG: tetratricopeptide repeat protein [Planctomycetota bacterium]|nr:tetratricopeptide repeat protein [Planctomycetota bacterium]